MKQGILLLIFSICLIDGYSQHKYLELKNTNTGKNFRFYIGDVITFRYLDDKKYYRAEIQDIVENHLIFEKNLLNINEIGEIDLRNHPDYSPFLRAAELKLPTAGIGYILIDQLNRSVIRGEPFSIDRNVMITGALFVSAGIILNRIRTKKFKIRKNKIIRTVNLFPNAIIE